MDISILLLQAGGSPMMTNVFFIGSMLLVVYFFMIRPQTKKAKLTRDFVGSLEIGSKIVTNGGVHGKIVAIEEGTFSIKIDKSTQIKIEADSINTERSKERYHANTEEK